MLVNPAMGIAATSDTNGISGVIHKIGVNFWAYRGHIVISCGRQAVAPALFLKNWPATSRFIHLLHPRVGLGKFDLVVVPAHDFANKTHGLPANVITTLGALNRLTPDNTAQTCKKWHPLWAALPAPKLPFYWGERIVFIILIPSKRQVG